MECYEVIELFSDYHDGSLEENKKVGVVDHLSACSHCRHSYKLISATLGQLVALPQIEVSPHFEERLWERIQQTESSWLQRLKGSLPTFQLPQIAPALATATALVILTVVAVMMRGYITPTPENMTSPMAAEQPAMNHPEPNTRANSPAQSVTGNPLAAPVSTGPSRSYIMNRITSDQFNDNQPILLRGTGEGNWSDESDQSNYIIDKIRSDSFEADSTQTDLIINGSTNSSPELRF